MLDEHRSAHVEPAERTRVAILGSGNIGTDLLYKIARSRGLQAAAMIGIDAQSDGLARARARDVWTTSDGLAGFLASDASHDVRIVFDATSAAAHRAHAPVLAQAGMVALDLTPAAIGEFVIPAIEKADTGRGVPLNLNFVSCGGQATAPIVHAIGQGDGRPVRYAEIVSTTASRSVGPGTRANLDDYVHTTSNALCRVAGAERAKTITIINPAEPPIMMRNTVYCLADSGHEQEIEATVAAMITRIQRYVPGYRLLVPLQFEHVGDSSQTRVTAITEVEGAGDYLEPYAGNLDIITSAAVEVAEQCAAALASGAELAVDAEAVKS
jgi:acetaldehyde dehydrogenase